MTKEQQVVGMKEQLVNTVNQMRADGYNFATLPPVFEWRYEDLPGIVFKLLIKEDLLLEEEVNQLELLIEDETQPE